MIINNQAVWYITSRDFADHHPRALIFLIILFTLSACVLSNTPWEIRAFKLDIITLSRRRGSGTRRDTQFFWSDVRAVFSQRIRKKIHAGLREEIPSKSRDPKLPRSIPRPRANRRGVRVVWSGAVRNSGEFPADFLQSVSGRQQSLSGTIPIKVNCRCSYMNAGRV